MFILFIRITAHVTIAARHAHKSSAAQPRFHTCPAVAAPAPHPPGQGSHAEAGSSVLPGYISRFVCVSARWSLMPWWSYVARIDLLHAISVWPEKYLRRPPPQRQRARLRCSARHGASRRLRGVQAHEARVHAFPQARAPVHEEAADERRHADHGVEGHDRMVVPDRPRGLGGISAVHAALGDLGPL